MSKTNAMIALNWMGIDPPPTRRVEIERMVERDERPPSRRPVRTASGGVTLAPPPGPTAKPPSRP